MKKIGFIIFLASYHPMLWTSPFKKLLKGAQTGNPDMVKTALREGADPSHTDKQGHTAFWYTAKRFSDTEDYKKTAAILLEKQQTPLNNEDLERAFKTGRTPLISMVAKKQRKLGAPLKKRDFIERGSHTNNASLLTVGLEEGILKRSDITIAVVQLFNPNQLPKKKIAKQQKKILRTAHQLDTKTTPAAASTIVQKETAKPQCTICQDNLLSDNPVDQKPIDTLSCYHSFHRACIKLWFDRVDPTNGKHLKDTCPLCRSGINDVNHNIDIKGLK